MSNSRDFMELLFNAKENINLQLHNFDTGIEPLESADLTKNYQLVCLNPLFSSRKDEHVSACRNFLIEFDDGSLKEQMEFVRETKLPFSACVFSGSKSLHFVVCLSTALNDKYYRHYFKCISKALLNLNDSQTGNPSRSVRFPNAIRRETGNIQKLYPIVRGRISLEELDRWLIERGVDPNYYEPPPTIEIEPTKDISKLPKTARDFLLGHYVYWRKSLFCTVMSLKQQGFDQDETLEILEQVISPDDHDMRVLRDCYK